LKKAESLEIADHEIKREALIEQLLITVTHRAAQCGLAIQETLKNYIVSDDITYHYMSALEPAKW
jgi:hypothetical protein